MSPTSLVLLTRPDTARRSPCLRSPRFRSDWAGSNVAYAGPWLFTFAPSAAVTFETPRPPVHSAEQPAQPVKAIVRSRGRLAPRWSSVPPSSPPGSLARTAPPPPTVERPPMERARPSRRPTGFLRWMRRFWTPDPQTLEQTLPLPPMVRRRPTRTSSRPTARLHRSTLDAIDRTHTQSPNDAPSRSRAWRLGSPHA